MPIRHLLHAPQFRIQRLARSITLPQRQYRLGIEPYLARALLIFSQPNSCQYHIVYDFWSEYTNLRGEHR